MATRLNRCVIQRRIGQVLQNAALVQQCASAAASLEEQPGVHKLAMAVFQIGKENLTAAVNNHSVQFSARLSPVAPAEKPCRRRLDRTKTGKRLRQAARANPVATQ
ncbi:hypothetical protein EaACW_2102 [Erwinia amylovora ACW56400]|uniref:Uncharacterized protein n=3 Tax=Erwinia amylovora TaxID=552 RepID=A0A831ESS6_ERWAM|nr:hypothetical protein EaACW_2102 [Erwinia amylovora ACW56400]CBA21042.1 hypothetical protein predicted by Glimmer/Critica [Erwinia amylovora CFBP1430]CBX80967.1 hypothetical protein predicted by Glimmer/Critica [Erwinia amylovora ATCC BAA-2158]CCO78949.1 hypothetical protein BN432_2154 [Erwinia amylovora Ea356]CCO82749.1 hypothetical protein BN433_2181 [Erwinia amylovora Ea266]CCO90313.1 hypothetical protein BN435_2145 [Erwinia amylovora 01SFR-BO]CCO94080.1 hypothetical protein BN437_2153 [